MARRAFTLVELLVVSALLLVAGWLALAGLSGLIDANSLGAAAQMVDDCLADGRQDAVARNLTVEVRIYAAASGNGYDALQLHVPNADGTTAALGAPVILPASTVIDATAMHSSLVANTAAPAADSADGRLNAQTRCFHFLPSGATDLAATGPWQLTLRPAAQSDPANFPANWACLTLDPLTGRAQMYRP